MDATRFMTNNLAMLSTGTKTYSSQQTLFPFTNALNRFRSRVWSPSGQFLIDATNNKIYINDGSNKTATIANLSYTTPALLATAIQVALNAVSSNWTCTYSTTTFKFTISNSGSVTIRFSVTTNAVYDDIGYTGVIDLTGTSFVADEQRNHTSEFCTFDFGYSALIQFAAMISTLGEVFTISDTATVTLYGNSINDFSAPPFTLALTRTDGGIFKFIPTATVSTYRYWKIEIIDRLNPLGPTGCNIGNIYLGDYYELTERTIANGYQKKLNDPSVISKSEAGSLWARRKIKYREINGGSLQWLKRVDKDFLEQMSNDLGLTSPYYVSFDPDLEYTSTLDELTLYAYNKSELSFDKQVGDKFSTSISIYEAV